MYQNEGLPIRIIVGLLRNDMYYFTLRDRTLNTCILYMLIRVSNA